MRSKRVKRIISVVVGALLLASVATWVVHWGSRITQDFAVLQQDIKTTSKEKLDASLEILKAIVGSIGTVATIVGGIVLYLNFRVANRSAKNAEESTKIAQAKLEQEAQKFVKEAELAQSRLITDRFSKAVELLGSKELEVRLGGIYALERIAKDSPEDYWTIMEILTGFVREHSRSRQKQAMNSSSSRKQEDISISKQVYFLLPTDIQAVFTVLNRRTLSYQNGEEQQLDLSLSNFSGVFMPKVSFKDMNLHAASFYIASLIGIDFRNSDLSVANLSKANLEMAKLSKATLHLANLSGTVLWEADLNEAGLVKADLSDTDLRRANLNKAVLFRAKLTRANLQETDFREADLQEVDLTESNLDKTDFRGAKGLAPKQIKAALNWDKAIYEEEFCELLGLPFQTKD